MFRFPFGTTQELNLDWFLEQWEIFKQEAQTALDGIDHALDDEIQRVEDAMTDLYAARDAAIAARNDALGYAQSANNSAIGASQSAQNSAASAVTSAQQAQSAAQSAISAQSNATNAGTSAGNALTQAQQSEAWATGEIGGVHVPPTAPQNQSNAKQYATNAQLSANAANTAKNDARAYSQDSKAWATGIRNGEPVTSEDETYQNNAKYYAESISGDAAAAAQSASAAAASAASVTRSEAQIAQNTADINTIEESIDDIKDLLGYEETEEVVINGFSANNESSTYIYNAPFVYAFNQNPFSETDVISKIKINIHTAGTLSLGVIKKADAISAESADRTKAIVKATITFTETGVQEVEVPPFSVANDEYLFIATTSDNIIWYYGSSGTAKGFLYVDGGGTWRSSSNSMGLDISFKHMTEITNVRESLNSVYNGKTISILGDSISTFAGYIPAGNETYYPAGTVTSVNDTWWKKLIDALGMILNINNSWSGSRVTTTGGDASAGCMSRCENLGTSPDVIIVWMGINDFNNEVALGTYDGKSAIPESTTTFREAYGIMLNKILTAYQTSEVWVCTLQQCERNGSRGFPEINSNNIALADFNAAIKELADSFGVKVLDHNKCGLTYQNMPVYNPDNLHPNKYGHSLVANNDIRQMDGAINKSYPIA